MRAAVASFKAKGETPIAYSLQQAAKDLGASGKRSIILASDGEESCVADPCPAAKALVAQGFDLQIDTVGLGANAATRRQLQCIADAVHGTYYDASTASELTRLADHALPAGTATLRAVRDSRCTPTLDAASAPCKARPEAPTPSRPAPPPRYYLLHREAGLDHPPRRQRPPTPQHPRRQRRDA